MQERIENALEALDSSEYSDEGDRANRDKSAAKPGPIRVAQPPIPGYEVDKPRKSLGYGRELSKEDDESQRTLKREINSKTTAERTGSAVAQPSRPQGTQSKQYSSSVLDPRLTKLSGVGARNTSTSEFPGLRLSKQQFQEDLEQPRNLHTSEYSDGAVMRKKTIPSNESLKPRIQIPMKGPATLSNTGRSLGGFSNLASETRLFGTPENQILGPSRDHDFRDESYSQARWAENASGPMDRNRQELFHTKTSQSQRFPSGHTGVSMAGHDQAEDRNIEHQRISKQTTQKMSRKSLRAAHELDPENEKDDLDRDSRQDRYRQHGSQGGRPNLASGYPEENIRIALKEDSQSRKPRGQRSDEDSATRANNRRRRLAGTRASGLDDEDDPEGDGPKLGELPGNGRAGAGGVLVEEAEEDFELFIENEAGYSFCAFMTSGDVHWIKKVIIFVFFSLYIVCSVLSVLDLVKYSESDCTLAVTTSVVYYLLCFVSIFLKFSGYVFIQMELLGRIDYTLKVALHMTEDSTLDPCDLGIDQSRSPSGILYIRLRQLQGNQLSVDDIREIRGPHHEAHDHCSHFDADGHYLLRHLQMVVSVQ